jgi:hypothetical protein
VKQAQSFIANAFKAALLMLAILCDGEFSALRSSELIGVDAALILAVDVSQSVDEDRYRLQIEGMAKALDDKAVADTIISGPYGRIAVQFIMWADGVETTIPWQIISSRQEASALANLMRQQTHRKGEYTCMARMMRTVDEDMLDDLPFTASRTILDISGDGIDNCADTSAIEDARDRLLRRRVTINGLPIIVSGENDVVGAGAYRAPGFGLRPLSQEPGVETTLDNWFKDHVIGGQGAFVQPSQGYEEISRAFRQKFLNEISSRGFKPERFAVHLKHYAEPASPRPTD